MMMFHMEQLSPIVIPVLPSLSLDPFKPPVAFLTLNRALIGEIKG
jgi:hypothetical protein